MRMAPHEHEEDHVIDHGDGGVPNHTSLHPTVSPPPYAYDCHLHAVDNSPCI